MESRYNVASLFMLMLGGCCLSFIYFPPNLVIYCVSSENRFISSFPVASRGCQRHGRGGSGGSGLLGHPSVWMRGLPPTPQWVLQP